MPAVEWNNYTYILCKMVRHWPNGVCPCSAATAESVWLIITNIQRLCRTRVSRCILVPGIIVVVISAVAVAIDGDVSDAVNNSVFVYTRLVIVVWFIVVIVACNRWWLVAKLRCLCICTTVTNHYSWTIWQCQFGLRFGTLFLGYTLT